MTYTLYYTPMRGSASRYGEKDFDTLDDAIKAGEKRVGYGYSPNETYIKIEEDGQAPRQLRWITEKGWLTWTQQDHLKMVADISAKLLRLQQGEPPMDCDKNAQTLALTHLVRERLDPSFFGEYQSSSDDDTESEED